MQRWIYIPGQQLSISDSKMRKCGRKISLLLSWSLSLLMRQEQLFDGASVGLKARISMYSSLLLSCSSIFTVSSWKPCHHESCEHYNLSITLQTSSEDLDARTDIITLSRSTSIHNCNEKTFQAPRLCGFWRICFWHISGSISIAVF